MRPRHSDSVPTPRGWHSRGYLPHLDAGNAVIQTICFRLADSLPGHVVESWQAELQTHPSGKREGELRTRIERYLDAGRGACWLGDSRIGAIVENALLHFDGERYRLLAWVVMPNHVHAVVEQTGPFSLSEIVGAWKSYTAKLANRTLGRTGPFWQADYFDRFIRDDEHLARAIAYIETNPVTAGLCDTAADWVFGSARRAPGSAPGTAGVPPAPAPSADRYAGRKPE